jgi:hypothetical protein
MATAPTYTSVVTTPNELLGRPQFNSFIQAGLDFKGKAVWKGDKRFFITFFPNSASLGESDPIRVLNTAIRTKLTGSFNNSAGAIISNNLAELSTGEISTIDTVNSQLALTSFTTLNQGYVAREYGGSVDSGNHNFSERPPIFISGSYCISRINDNNPSLLVELNKDQQLPDNTGNEEFIIIPPNLHPFIKDNLEFFLTKAGVNVSGDASQFIELDETNRNLP